MKKVFRPILAIVLAISSIFIFASCSGSPLPEGVDEEAVISSAKEIVTQISNREYEMVVEKLDDQMKQTLDADGMQEAFGANLDRLGKLESFQSEAAAGGTSSEIGDYSTVALVCKYENGKAVYTISIDLDGKICGLYMK